MLNAEFFFSKAWAQYANLGLLSLSFPEQFGGLGGNAVDIMLVIDPRRVHCGARRCARPFHTRRTAL